VYELDDGRVGECKFIGRTFFKAGVDWYGFELTGDQVGKNR
jgi:dynactin complex subunit